MTDEISCPKELIHSDGVPGAGVEKVTPPDRFVSPCPPLEECEAEILTVLIEEAAEVQQRATKMLRFGRDEVQPGQSHSNSHRLSLEVGDLLAMCEIAARLHLIRMGAVEEGKDRKYARLAKYMQSDLPFDLGDRTVAPTDGTQNDS